jgi:uncharacterized repeat protein (TIGR04138 family)
VSAQLDFADDVMGRIRARAGRYHERAFLFVLAALEFEQGRLPARRHVTGAELSNACRDYAREQYGLLARTVLEHWGVRTTADFGAIVYALIDAGLLSRQDDDRLEDFHDVYAFGEAFDRGYPWDAWREDLQTTG